MEPVIEEITRDRYDELESVLPCIWLIAVNEEPVQHGFAVCEAYTHNTKGVVLIVCYKRDDKYYKSLGNILTDNNEYIQYDYYQHEFAKNYSATLTNKNSRI